MALTASPAAAPKTSTSWRFSARRRHLIYAAGAAYVAATAIGVTMRMALVGANVGVAFDHLLHSHSHTLYFGWAALAILVGAMEAIPETGRWLSATAVSLAFTTPAILVGFLALGYHPVTIAIATVVMFGWYVAIWLWWRQSRGIHSVTVRLFRVAFAYLVAASLGVWALAIQQATEIGNTLGESLAVHAFLLGFAWFLVIGVVGLIVANSRSLGLSLDFSRIDRALTWWAPLAFLTFPLGVANGPEVAWLGPLARGAGLALIYPAWIWARTLWRGAPGDRFGRVWRVVATWFLLAALATSTTALFGSAALTTAGRQGIVFYLHVLLLGFVTTSLFAVMTPGSTRVTTAHGLGLVVMLTGLAMASAGVVMDGFWVALAGAIWLWLVGVGWITTLPRLMSN